MPLQRPPDSVVTDVLREHWGIAAAFEQHAAGVSRSTWRVDGGLWLAHADPTQQALFRREARLLEALPALLAHRNPCCCVPELVRTLGGESIAVGPEGVWRLSRELEGREPDAREPSTYPALGRLLAELHAALALLPETLKVCDTGAVERAEALIRAYGTPSFRFATGDARERRAVGAIVDWLRPRIGALASLPRQLTHGDWIPRNLKLGSGRWGVLDWEFAGVDPVVMDLGQTCSTILMWSGSSEPVPLMASVIESYRACSGRDVSMEAVRVAMATYWLQNYGYWRDRQVMRGDSAEVLSRQPERLLAVGEFVGAC